ncbi:Protein-lysine N-methyltransferase efm5 [Friedmanniomyces endolithicus]|nr:Protein-lysine N-methyltransferase efm5 [Friedmanniomyces endolithicus]KAK0951837.1 Protein-lysine N-methyltransferase efm5 [Friedmanniomyces endolithicus]
MFVVLSTSYLSAVVFSASWSLSTGKIRWRPKYWSIFGMTGGRAEVAMIAVVEEVVVDVVMLSKRGTVCCGEARNVLVKLQPQAPVCTELQSSSGEDSTIDLGDTLTLHSACMAGTPARTIAFQRQLCWATPPPPHSPPPSRSPPLRHCSSATRSSKTSPSPAPATHHPHLRRTQQLGRPHRHRLRRNRLPRPLHRQPPRPASCIVVVPFRDEYTERHLNVSGDLGRVIFIECDLRNITSIKESVRHSDIVYNLLGWDYGTNNFNFDSVHVEGTRRIVEAVAKYDINSFVQVSTHSANPQSPSRYHRTKYQGESTRQEESLGDDGGAASAYVRVRRPLPAPLGERDELAQLQ